MVESEINGIDYDYAIIELEIKNDSTYTYTEYSGYKSELNSYQSWKKKSRSGVFKKIRGKKYLMSELFEEEKESEVKITRNKIIIYAYNSDFKKVKGIELKKASL